MFKNRKKTTLIMNLTSACRTTLPALQIAFVILWIHILSPSDVMAENASNERYSARPARDVIWSFESSLLNFNMTLPDTSELDGSAGSFTVGYGRTRENAWLVARLHIISGPWGTARSGTFDSDYSGTMFDIEYGAAFPRLRLRSGSCPILSIAGGYLDISGRNIGGNKKSQYGLKASNSESLEQDFRTSLGELTVTPSIGWSWTRPARPAGNEEELLQTRVESSIVKLGAILPLYSRSRVTVNRIRESAESSATADRISSAGPAKGFAIFSSLTIWLGI
jgi:hypothetical protein